MTVKRTIIPESPIGLYVWEMPDGRVVGDSDGNFLNIPAKFGDLKRIRQLTDYVKSMGIEHGQAKFMSGRRRVTDSEYDDMMERLLDGKVADWLDPGQFEDA